MTCLRIYPTRISEYICSLFRIYFRPVGILRDAAFTGIRWDLVEALLILSLILLRRQRKLLMSIMVSRFFISGAEIEGKAIKVEFKKGGPRTERASRGGRTRRVINRTGNGRRRSYNQEKRGNQGIRGRRRLGRRRGMNN
jgi:hypothetical protein